jgi:hypothetical protein
MNRPRAVRSSAAILKLLGLGAATTTDPVVLLRAWSSRPVTHVVIDFSVGGVNRDLLPQGTLSARFAVSAACDVSRETRRRVILSIHDCYVLVEGGEVVGVINMQEGLA